MTGCILIRAIRAAAGKYEDIDKRKLSATLDDGGLGIVDRRGYIADIGRLDGADVDLTSELLADGLRLTHPICHPSERPELAPPRDARSR
jgi:hypothetical protein